jgi:hypothetical protein
MGIRGCLTTIVLAIAIAFAANYSLNSRYDEVLRYVSNNSGGITAEINSDLCLPDLGMPEYRTVKGKTSGGGLAETLERYERVDGKIVRKDVIEIGTQLWVDDQGFFDQYFQLRGYPSAKEAMGHEYGHWFAKHYGRTLPTDFGGDHEYWETMADGDTNTEINRLIGEGIATFFQKYRSGEVPAAQDMPTSKEFQSMTSAEQSEVKYETIYSNVFPILKKHGLRGIQYLLTNPPEVDDMSQTDEHLEAVLGFLDSQYSSPPCDSPYLGSP